MNSKRFIIIGAGKMGKAILKSLISNFSGHEFVIIESDRMASNLIDREFSKKTLPSLEGVTVQASDILILAVKPANIRDVFTNKLTTNPLLLSIAAGVTLNELNSITGTDRIVRLMPNTHIKTGSGVTFFAASKGCSKEDISKAEQMFSTMGITISIAENEMNAATAISGSGPAYIYYFMEGLLSAAISNGLDEKTSIEVIKKLLEGSAKILIESKKNLEELRIEVTTQGGCTEAAIKSLSKSDLHSITKLAIESAIARLRELGKE